MKIERKSILEFIKGLFRKENAEGADLPGNVTDETVGRLIERTLGEDKSPDADKSDGSDAGGFEEADGDTDSSKEADSDADSSKKESCPYATKRAIVESIAEIKRFAEEHQLAASVLKSLLMLLAEIALGALRGKVSRNILDTLLRAINYEIAIDEAFRKGHTDGRNEMIEERYPSQDDGLPHINGGLLRPEGSSIFDVAAEARK